MVESSNPDIICRTEMWLTSSILNSDVFPPGYTIYRKDRKGGYCGVVLAIKDNLTSQEIVPVICDSEAVFVEITLSMTASLIVCSIYHPPSHGVQQMESLCTMIKDVMKAHKKSALWLSGDINLPDIN